MDHVIRSDDPRSVDRRRRTRLDRHVRGALADGAADQQHLDRGHGGSHGPQSYAVPDPCGTATHNVHISMPAVDANPSAASGSSTKPWKSSRTLWNAAA